jgi:hypothetical protein
LSQSLYGSTWESVTDGGSKARRRRPAHQADHDLAARGGGEELGEHIAELAAQISAATYELLMMLRDFDERGVRRGEISYSKVRALTRIATPANEQGLLIFARAGTAAHVERLVRGKRRVDRIANGEERRHAARYLRAYTDEDGLAPEAGAALLRALDAGVEALYGPRRGQPSGGGQEAAEAAQVLEDTSVEQRRADALGLVAESALASGLDPGTRGDRYQVVVHVDAGVLAPRGEGGSSWLADGSHFRGNVQAAGLRLGAGGDAACRGWPRARRRPPHPRHLARPAPRPRASRRGLPLPGLRQEAVRCPPRGAVGRWRRHQPGVTLPDWWGGPVDYAWEIDWLRWRDGLDPEAAAG